MNAIIALDGFKTKTKNKKQKKRNTDKAKDNLDWQGYWWNHVSTREKPAWRWTKENIELFMNLVLRQIKILSRPRKGFKAEGRKNIING